MSKRKNNMDIENEMADGTALRCQDEVRLEKSCKIGNHSVVIPVFQKRIDYFEYNFLKSYAYALYSEMLTDSEISIQSLNAPISSVNQALMPPSLVAVNEDNLPTVANDTLHLNLVFRNSSYLASISCIRSDTTIYFISICGNETKVNGSAVLGDYLVKQALKNSCYKGKILNMRWDYDGHLDIRELNREEFIGESFDKIFIPQNTKKELIRFAECVEHYEDIGASVRFLLSGTAGTGKTKSIRTIINKCKGVTTLIPEGSVNFQALFSFANLFPKSLICLDDLDLYFGNRETVYSPNSLSDFLGYMDGFIKNSIFLLASTNSKQLVDMAARRPGRFDMLLDFTVLNKDNYTDLIKANTDDEEIISLFDSNIFKIFERRKPPGSFIVNAVKQLKIMKALHPDCDLKEYVHEFIEFSYAGFYKNRVSEQETIGFLNNN